MTLFLDKIILLALLITSSSLAWISPHSVIHWRDSKRFSWNQLSTSTGAGAGAASVSSCQVLGGDIRRIKLENEEDGFLAKMSVPTFAAFENQKTSNDDDDDDDDDIVTRPVIRKSLEGLVPGAFLLENVLSTEECNSIIDTCEEINFENFQSGKNQHGAIQILVTFDAAEKIALAIAPFIDMQSVNSIAASMPGSNPDVEYNICGLNRRWRIYRYSADNQETFAPHIDAGFKPSTLSKDGTTLLWDSTTEHHENDEYPDDTVSRLTVLMYINDDFVGGHTKFYSPVSDGTESEVIAAVKPKTGSVLLFPQAVGEAAVEYARLHWPLHEGSPVSKGNRPKYVIRSDILCTKAREGLSEEEKVDPLWKNDELVRKAFMPRSPALSSIFLNHIKSLYNPHMGVENAGTLLYSLIRFTKIRSVVEIGAGFTTMWILQALKDNDDEMKQIKLLDDTGNARLLDVTWIPQHTMEDYQQRKSSLLCIDNCLHQRETATGAGALAKTLGLSEYLKFVKGDAFDMNFDPKSVDLLWCDFGVGSRMREFASGAWNSIRPGGFLVCHSTLTNYRTREWLEAVRRKEGVEVTGIPPDEVVELSLLEPTKTFQNAVTILQRRKATDEDYKEPIYSEYA